MKTTSQIQNANKRHEADPRASRPGRNFPQIDCQFQSPTLHGGCGTPSKFRRPSFYRMSSEYFAEEAPRSFAIEAAFFSALILIVALPVANCVQAVATLIHTLGVL